MRKFLIHVNVFGWSRGSLLGLPNPTELQLPEVQPHEIPMHSFSGTCQCLVVLSCGLLFRARWWDDGCLCPRQPGGDGALKSPFWGASASG